MISPILLIAEREFRTYVATLSFWLSLAVAPLGALGVLVFSGHEQPPLVVTIQANDPAIAESARKALQEAGKFEGRRLTFGQAGTVVNFTPVAPNLLDVTFGAEFPFSPAGRAMVRHVVERDAARRSLKDVPLIVREKIDAVAPADTAVLSRLTAMTLLWLMLTGSLGMLLQAIVRERVNRALESLLACTRPWQIVAGKLAGVGAVSMLILAAWGGTAVLLASFTARDGLLGAILAGISNPAVLAWDLAIYVCAYLFYGSATVMLGALARDSASAQNAARPMFILLLAGFFAALTSVGETGTASWLTYVPPFTPFLLLTQTSTGVAAATQVFVLGLLLFLSIGMVFLAGRCLNIAPREIHILSGNIWRVQPLV